MILEGEFPPDNRVEKEIFSLIKAGHKVDIACYTRQNRSKIENKDGYVVYRLPLSGIIYKLSAAVLIVPFYLMYWKKFLNKIFANNHYDAIHVHDLPLTKLGYYFKRKYNCMLVCDQHEYYSNWIVHTAHYNTQLGKGIKLLSNWRKYERKYLQRADLVVTVEEPLRQCYIDYTGIPEDKIILVPNTPSIEVFNSANLNQNIIEKYKDDFMLFYAGGIDRLRGLELVLEAAAILKGKIKNLKIVIAGRESKGYNIMEKVRKLDIDEIVDFVKWIPHNTIPSYLYAAKIGFFTPPGNRDEIHNTIATKIYQYVHMGLPVIVSNVRLMSEFVHNNEVGYVIKDAKEFSDACLELYTDKEKWNRLSQNCKKISHQYIWENTVKGLLSFYAKKR